MTVEQGKELWELFFNMSAFAEECAEKLEPLFPYEDTPSIQPEDVEEAYTAIKLYLPKIKDCIAKIENQLGTEGI